MRAGPLLPALALFAACGAPCEPYDPCFVPSWRVSDLRVLAVRADPPEAVVDLAQGLVPEVQVRALVVDQSRTYSTTATGRLCVPGRTSGCPDDAVPSGAPKLETAPALSVLAPPDLIAQALREDPLRGYGGIRVRLDLALDDGGGKVLRADKILLYSPTAPGLQPNRPIELARLRFVKDGALVDDVLPGGIATLPEPFGYGLRPVLADGAGVEEYDVVDLSGRTVHLREQVSYDFFSTAGLPFGKPQPTAAGLVINDGFAAPGAAQGDEPAPGAEPANGLAQLNAWGGGQLWVVARDGRGAEAWMQVFVSAPCTGVNPDLCHATYEFACGGEVHWRR